jgi:hypothetical protein
MSFTAGQKLRASELNSLGNLVGRHTRTSDETSALGGTAAPVMSVRAPVVAGRTYLVSLWCDIYVATGSATVQVHNRMTTDDVEPTVGTAVYATPRSDIICVTSSQLYPCYARGLVDISSDGYLRVLTTIVRSAGAGNISMGAGAINPATLLVEDVGETIAESGTDY